MSDMFGKTMTVWGVGLMLAVMIVTMNLEPLNYWLDNGRIIIKESIGLIICLGILLLFIAVNTVPALNKLVMTPINQMQKITEEIMNRLL